MANKMQGYSIAGYLNAVMRRSAKTILVEGVTDKSVLQRQKMNAPLALEQIYRAQLMWPLSSMTTK